MEFFKKHKGAWEVYEPTPTRKDQTMEFTHNVIADIATALHITDQHVLEPLPDSWRSEAWDFMDQFTDEYCPLALLEDELVDATDLLAICQTAKNLGVI